MSCRHKQYYTLLRRATEPDQVRLLLLLFFGLGGRTWYDYDQSSLAVRRVDVRTFKMGDNKA